MKRRAKKLPRRKRTGPKGGQLSFYKPEFSERAHELCLLGLTDREISENLGIHESTFYLWKKEHPEFSESIRLGKDQADARIAKSLFHRALGFEHPAVKIFNDEGVPLVVNYVEHYPPDTEAAKFWLKNRQRGRWNDRHEVTGANGGPVRIQQLSDAELAAIVAAGGGGGGTVAPP